MLKCSKLWFQLEIFTEKDLHGVVSAVEDDALFD